MCAASPKLCRTVRLICPRQPEAPGLSLSTYEFSNPLAFLGPRLVFGASEPSLSLRSHLCRTLLSSIPVCPLLSFPETVLWSLFCGFYLLGLPEPVPRSGGHLAKAFKAFFSATFPQVLPHSSDTGLESFDVGFWISTTLDKVRSINETITFCSYLYFQPQIQLQLQYFNNLKKYFPALKAAWD